MPLVFVDGIAVQIVRKNISNMHLYVNKDCSVVLNVPENISQEEIDGFLKSKSKWMKKHIMEFSEIPMESKHMYESGEVFKIFADDYILRVSYGSRYSAVLSDGDILFTVRENSPPSIRKTHLDSFFAKLLREKISSLLPEWENKTGLKCSSWDVKPLKGKWGCCAISKKEITFNLSLIEKPEICIEYIILHELTHTRFRNHDSDFYSVVSEHMPDWKRVNRLLNYS